MAGTGTGYDQLNVRGTNQLGGSTLHVSVGFPPQEGEEFVIINNDGSEAIQGTFAGLPNDSIVTANNLQFRIRYSAIFENDVVLTLTNTSLRFASASISGGNGDGISISMSATSSMLPSPTSPAGSSPALAARSSQKLRVSPLPSGPRPTRTSLWPDAARTPVPSSSVSVLGSFAAPTSISSSWCKLRLMEPSPFRSASPAARRGLPCASTIMSLPSFR